MRERLIPTVVLFLAAGGCDTTGGSIDGPFAPGFSVGAGFAPDGDAFPGADAVSEPEGPVQGFCEPNSGPFPVRPAPGLETTLPRLHVEGTEVVDEGGNPVALRGVNLGSWMAVESWIAGLGQKDEEALLAELAERAEKWGVGDLLEAAKVYNHFEWIAGTRSHLPLVLEWKASMLEHAGSRLADVETLWAWFDAEPWVFEERSLWTWLQRRFGYDESLDLRWKYQDVWIGEIDFERISALGLNMVRVPIWFDHLETDEASGAYFRTKGWNRLHEIAVLARKHGLYVVLDLHGAPGGQNPWWHSGLEDGGHLWSNPACVEKTARLWAALANYFADDPHVAVFDLLNEPRPNEPGQYAAVHGALYDAVREHAPDTIVMAEDGFLDRSVYATPGEMGWENAMFSIHLYPKATSAAGYVAKVEAELDAFFAGAGAFDVPLFAGEFNPGDAAGDGEPWAPEALDGTLALLNERGVHWALWTWKFWYETSWWGVYRPAAGASKKVELKVSTREEIEAAFESLRSDDWVPVEGYAAALSARSQDPVAPLDPGAGAD